MAERPLRADAVRNRAKVLRVAYETFAAEGLGVPIDEIARRAGVGAGTVYRHFPTKDLLFQAIVQDRVRQLTDSARELVEQDPGEAVYRFLLRMVDEAAVDQGLVDAIAGVGIDIETVLPDAERDFLGVIAELIAQGQRAGTVRSDVDVADVKTLMVGLQAMRRYRGDIAKAFQVVRDGLTP
ncbi:TetR/AcrR family transcriptional regulator [Kibdelosporangium phytohabitans]|uniref:TetR family transcriptional regulator n=1 Tax=Kibdelosporangium phytohabitans TaxID=860235 RepID=A0A0N9I3I8_9PSEU|nr:TetR/AcrR family transcriptional regulator [Kibdelosporangium phytohabitans]ALG09072.1 TetR family transcriptional regulator [Kibdelosporangium phytohabitans]MBE1469736.1 AcrR family transcriptional regulator [Kibdelosporangium phytohabitans]